MSYRASMIEFQENNCAIHCFNLPDGSAWYEVELTPGYWAGAETLEQALEMANQAEVIWR